MRTGRARGTLVARLERLESRAVAFRSFTTRFGHLRPLSRAYKGERHIVIAKHLASRSGQEWVEFEEQPGPDPNRPQEHTPGRPTYLDIVFVAS